MRQGKYLLLILLLGLCSLHAWTASYSVKTMGIQVASLEMNMGLRSLEVWSRTEGSSSLAPAMDNYYKAEFDARQLPSSYLRIVRQETDSDTVQTVYDQMRRAGHQKRFLSGELVSFELETDTRDLFSLLAHIAVSPPDTDRAFVIDANGVLWDAELSREEDDNVRTRLGRLRCRAYSLNLIPREAGKAPYVDMVTNNILNPDTQLKLWIAENGLITKAQVRRGLSVLNWELVSYNQ